MERPFSNWPDSIALSIPLSKGLEPAGGDTFSLCDGERRRRDQMGKKVKQGGEKAEKQKAESSQAQMGLLRTHAAHLGTFQTEHFEGPLQHVAPQIKETQISALVSHPGIATDARPLKISKPTNRKKLLSLPFWAYHHVNQIWHFWKGFKSNTGISTLNSW